MPRRLLSAAAACAFVLGLAACGDGNGETVTTPPPSVDIDAPSDGGGDGGQGSDGDDAEPSDGGGDAGTTAASDIPAPDPADYPGMDENTEEGAIQAFRYYIALNYWAHQSGNTDALDSLYRDSCTSCVELRDEAVELANSNNLWSNVSINDVWIESSDSPNFDVEISYGFDLAPHTRPADAGGTHETQPTEMTAISGLDWANDSWVVGGMQIDVSQYN